MSPQPEDLADQLHSAAIHLLRQLRREDDSIGISAPRLSALSVVVFAGPVTLGQLAAAEQVKPPTMTRIVTGLEEEGLVERRNDAKDGRLTQIHATKKGRKVLGAGRARRVETLAAAMRSLDAKSRGELACGIEIVRRVISTISARTVGEGRVPARQVPAGEVAPRKVAPRKIAPRKVVARRVAAVAR